MNIRELEKKNTFQVAMMALISGIYIILVYIFAPISWGILQFRIAEIIMPFIIFLFNRKIGSIGISIGCFIANMSYVSMLSVPILDLTLGTFSSFIVVFLSRTIYTKYIERQEDKIKKLLLQQLLLLFASFLMAFIVGLYLPVSIFGFFDLTFSLISILSIFISEAIIYNVFGYMLYKALEKAFNAL